MTKLLTGVAATMLLASTTLCQPASANSATVDGNGNCKVEVGKTRFIVTAQNIQAAKAHDLRGFPVMVQKVIRDNESAIGWMPDDPASACPYIASSLPASVEAAAVSQDATRPAFRRAKVARRHVASRIKMPALR